MPRPKSDTHKHTLNLRDGDFAKLQSLFPEHGAGPIIRAVVSRFIDRLESGRRTPEELDLEV